MKFNLRLLYLYLFSFVGLLITIIGSIQIIDLGLKTYVFKVSEYSFYSPPFTPDGRTPTTKEEIDQQKLDKIEMDKQGIIEQASQRKRQLSTSLSMILVGVPVYLYHWKTIKKENRPENWAGDGIWLGRNWDKLWCKLRLSNH